VRTVCLRLLPDSFTAAIETWALLHANHSATEYITNITNKHVKYLQRHGDMQSGDTVGTADAMQQQCRRVPVSVNDH